MTDWLFVYPSDQLLASHVLRGCLYISALQQWCSRLLHLILLFYSSIRLSIYYMQYVCHLATSTLPRLDWFHSMLCVGVRSTVRISIAWTFESTGCVRGILQISETRLQQAASTCMEGVANSRTSTSTRDRADSEEPVETVMGLEFLHTSFFSIPWIMPAISLLATQCSALQCTRVDAGTPRHASLKAKYCRWFPAHFASITMLLIVDLIISPLLSSCSDNLKRIKQDWAVASEV